MRLVYGGTTTATGGLSTFDSVNAILFGNPNDNPSFDGPFDCASGGIVAIGGPWSRQDNHLFKGETFRAIVGGDVVTNRGLECWIGSQRRAEEVFAHELGHTLGLAHSSDNRALMRARTHGNNRGAALGDDDRAGLCFLYGTICNASTPPAAPASLRATALSGARVRLLWQDRSNDETAFQVERTAGGGFQLLVELGAGVAEFIDAGVTAGGTYQYRVRALGLGGVSAWSNTATVTVPAGPPPPAAPTGLVGEVLSATQVRLRWQDHASGETAFQVEGKSSGAFTLLATAAANVTQLTVTGLEEQTDYTLRVRAVGEGGPSAYSNEVSVTTLPLDTSPPVAPTYLLAVPRGPGEALLRWADTAHNEVNYRVERRLGDGPFEVVVTLPRGSDAYVAEGLVAGQPYTFRVRAGGVEGSSPYSPTTSLRLPAAGIACQVGAETSCLLGGRFAVEVRWHNQRDETGGGGRAVPLTDQSSTFWFFEPATKELMVKVLDGRTVNGRFWFFFGALSDVEYWVTVADTTTGAFKTYRNPPGNLCGVADTRALGQAQGSALREALPQEAALFPGAALFPDMPWQGAGEATTACVAGPNTLCLLDGRVRVEARFSAPTGASGPARAVADTDRGGFFWFFGPQNLEIIVKALDGRSVNGHFWVFWGALSDVEYDLTFTDMATGETFTVHNEQGNFCGGASIRAF